MALAVLLSVLVLQQRKQHRASACLVRSGAARCQVERVVPRCKKTARAKKHKNANSAPKPGIERQTCAANRRDEKDTWVWDQGEVRGGEN
jgi:hypothetical protein